MDKILIVSRFTMSLSRSFMLKIILVKIIIIRRYLKYFAILLLCLFPLCHWPEKNHATLSKPNGIKIRTCLECILQIVRTRFPRFALVA